MADYVGRVLAFPEVTNSGLVGNGSINGVTMTIGGAVPDTAAPQVYFDQPLPGSQVARNTSIIFRVMEETALAKLLVTVNFKAVGWEEVAYRAGAFARAYQGSTVEEISGGFRFVLVRRTGWPESPTIQVDAVDTGGNPEELGP